MENKKVLHLDDNPIFNDLIKLLFDDIGVEYKFVLKKEEAWKELKKSLPDLLIADLMLEDDWNERPGVEFIKNARKEYPELKIMVLSARSDKFLRDELKDYVVHYETKSFRPSIFKKNIVKILSN